MPSSTKDASKFRSSKYLQNYSGYNLDALVQILEGLGVPVPEAPTKRELKALLALQQRGFLTRAEADPHRYALPIVSRLYQLGLSELENLVQLAGFNQDELAYSLSYRKIEALLDLLMSEQGLPPAVTSAAALENVIPASPGTIATAAYLPATPLDPSISSGSGAQVQPPLEASQPAPGSMPSSPSTATAPLATPEHTAVAARESVNPHTEDELGASGTPQEMADSSVTFDPQQKLIGGGSPQPSPSLRQSPEHHGGSMQEPSLLGRAGFETAETVRHVTLRTVCADRYEMPVKTEGPLSGEGGGFTLVSNETAVSDLTGDTHDAKPRTGADQSFHDKSNRIVDSPLRTADRLKTLEAQMHRLATLEARFDELLILKARVEDLGEIKDHVDMLKGRFDRPDAREAQADRLGGMQGHAGHLANLSSYINPWDGQQAVSSDYAQPEQTASEHITRQRVVKEAFEGFQKQLTQVLVSFTVMQLAINGQQKAA